MLRVEAERAHCAALRIDEIEAGAVDHAARNHGIQESRGEYLVFLDADDRLLPDHLAISLEAFRSMPYVLPYDLQVPYRKVASRYAANTDSNRTLSASGMTPGACTTFTLA